MIVDILSIKEETVSIGKGIRKGLEELIFKLGGNLRECG